MTSSGSQSLVLGSKGFTRGVHYWEVKVDSQAQHGNIFIGELACSQGPCEVPGPSCNLFAGVSTHVCKLLRPMLCGQVCRSATRTCPAGWTTASSATAHCAWTRAVRGVSVCFEACTGSCHLPARPSRPWPLIDRYSPHQGGGERSYGPFFWPNDTIGVVLNMDEGYMAFVKDAEVTSSCQRQSLVGGNLCWSTHALPSLAHALK